VPVDPALTETANASAANPNAIRKISINGIFLSSFRITNKNPP
jgi:hypothetical protein